MTLTTDPALLDSLKRFIGRLHRAAISLLTIHTAVGIGKDQMAAVVAKDPTAGFIIGSGPPHWVTTLDTPMAEGVRLLEEFPDPQAELIQNQIIQYWYEFLDATFRWAVDQHLSGGPRLPVKLSEQLKASLDLTQSITLTETVVDGSVRSFQFLPSDQRFEIVLQVLDLNKNELNQYNIKLMRRHVQLRNVLVHHDGVLSAKDTICIGELIYDKNHHPLRMKPHMRVQLSTWEVLRAVRHIGELATQMITGQPPPSTTPKK